MGEKGKGGKHQKKKNIVAIENSKKKSVTIGERKVEKDSVTCGDHNENL